MVFVAEEVLKPFMSVKSFSMLVNSDTLIHTSILGISHLSSLRNGFCKDTLCQLYVNVGRSDYMLHVFIQVVHFVLQNTSTTT